MKTISLSVGIKHQQTFGNEKINRILLLSIIIFETSWREQNQKIPRMNNNKCNKQRTISVRASRHIDSDIIGLMIRFE